MIPNHKLTSTYVDCNFLYEGSEEMLVEKHLGGVSLQNTNLGLKYQYWEMTYEGTSIKLRSLTNSLDYTIKQEAGIQDLSFAFSANMNLNFCYTKEDVVYFTFYDSSTNGNREIAFLDISYPKLVYDDLRETQTQNGDVLFFYINNTKNKLCYRIQRDRFNVEYELTTVAKGTRLVRVGMSDKYRLKFKLQGY